MHFFGNLLKCFAPPQAIPQLSSDQIDRAYHRYRWMVFTGIFLGYGASYLVRNTLLSLALPTLIKQYHFTRGQLGNVLTAFSIAYGFSKFLMGNVSDRSNPRFFLALGLAIPALTCVGFAYCGRFYDGDAWCWFFNPSILIMAVLMFINGWGNGMCYPPCVRVLAHWYTVKERSFVMSAWNISHNVGGCLVSPLALGAVQLFGAVLGEWQSIFYIPAAVVGISIVLVIWMVRDTPQSVGLPAVEEYHKKSYLQSTPSAEQLVEKPVEAEKELTSREIFFKHIFNNRAIWYLSLANIFVYLVRFGVASWIPLYLEQVKGFQFKGQALGVLLFELAGIPAMMICGYISHRFFNDRRTPVIIISMVLTVFAILLYWLNPVGNDMLDMVALICIGFLIYGPVVLIGMQAVDVVYKKAVGTATGLTGFFGYVGGTACASTLMGYMVDYWGWNAGFIMLLLSCILAILFLIPIWSSGGAKEE